MRVPEQQNVRAHLLRPVPGGEKPVLHMQRVTVRDQHALVLKEKQPLGSFKATEVAVARHLLQRDVRIKPVQLLRVAPAVAEVDDQAGIHQLDRPLHMFDIAVGIG